MYRRGFSINSLRNSARSYYYRFQRVRNPRAWMAAAGCLVVSLLAACCVVVVAVAVLLLNPASRGALAPLLGLG